MQALTFNLIVILMGRVSSIYAAAQSVIAVIAGLTFIIPISISNAIAVKVGHANGAKNYVDIKNYSIAGISFSVMFMICCSILFALFPESITKLFTKDITLINVIVPIIYILAVFQIFDGFQCTMSGILKGLKKTQMVFVANFFGYILVGLSLGSFLAFKLNMNLLGFWLGISFASFLICLILFLEFIRIYTKIKKEAS